MIEAFSHTFMQNALLAALLASIACGVIGSLVVVNRLVFMAGGIAHSAYGGVGLAFFLGLPVLPCTIGFTLAASTLMAAATFGRIERADTFVGMLWAAGMALGVLLLDATPGYNVDLMSYLFGSILAVPRSDILLMAVLVAGIVGLVCYNYKNFLAMSYDAEFARTRGVRVRALHHLLLGLVAVSVVITIQVVGLLLVIALMTIPPFVAERHVTSLGRMMAAASAWSVLFCLLGLWASYSFNVSSGASIIGAATAGSAILFGALHISGRIRAGRPRA
jgi:zinc transport system permease protein